MNRMKGRGCLPGEGLRPLDDANKHDDARHDQQDVNEASMVYDVTHAEQQQNEQDDHDCREQLTS